MSSTERVHALVDDRLALTVGLGALLFLAVGVAQFLFDTAPNVWAPSWVAIFTAAVLGAEGLLLWRRRDVIKRVSAPIVVTATAVVVAINPLVYIAFTGIAYPAIGTLLVIVALGALVPYPRIAVVLIALVNVAAAAYAIHFTTDVSFGSVILQLVKADVLALIIALTWQRTERRLHRANETIRALAITDDLTGLLNRRGLTTRGHVLLDEALTRARPVVVGSIDIDGLKHLNDTRGHAEGDRMIQAAGGSLRWLLDAGQLAARIGGDEFVVLIVSDSDTGVRQLQNRVVESISALPQSASIGWAAPEPGATTTLTRLLAESDREMLSQKRRRRDGRKDAG
ncbi:GGDEF domain-containing protein [Gordonia polyisoprenivorans]|uniref:GGDEF domain-containing protein n=1 Tax=Gordonia polyisoprenivorans TaxID=84595 RepID=UPI001AD6F91E|nr:GGDEF domain-containing protein [Gordonia polyisoprenivorans]QTI70502.1 GGDEF domain-containing protein [Gordonia polyisoprenivorans]